ncbi:MAG: hypothetical protein GF411_08555 [Candidatus Lokiarchaeota archaeon]|nr:hypothetical protein [Candidatus Lokiarchaeota archaeon]
MPIHDFGPLKKKEDIKENGVGDKTHKERKDVPQVPEKMLRPEVRQEATQENEQVDKKSGKVKKEEHPLVHGTLEIEEEEL